MLHETRALPRATGEVVPLGEAPDKSLHSWGDAFETTRGRDLVEEMVELHFHRGCQAAPGAKARSATPASWQWWCGRTALRARPSSAARCRTLS